MRLEHIEVRMEEQRLYMNTIHNACNHGVHGNHGKIEKNRIKARIETIRDQWETFRINHRAIELAIAKLDENEREHIKGHEYFQDNLYAKTYEELLDNIEQLSVLLDTQSDAESRPQSARSSAQTPTELTVQTAFCQGPRLPRIDLPKFNGDFSEWLPFRDLFASLVLNKSNISAVEKLQYLKNCLHGSAGQLLKNTALTAENFQKSWDALTSFYENERLIINSELESLFAIKKISKESAADIEYIYSSTMQVYRTLETLGRPVHSWDDILVFMITQRLDPESIRNWENHLGSSKQAPTWDKMKDFLLTRMLSLKAMEKSQGHKMNYNSRSTLRSHCTRQDDGPSTNETRGDSCILCSSSHSLTNCPQYQRKTPQQRRDFVIEKKCCFNCLGHHYASKCTSTRRCNKCGKKHHTSLHFQNNSQHEHSKPTTMNDPTNAHSSNVASINHACHTLNNHGITLLATALVQIRDQRGDLLLIRALLDQGSEITLVTENLVQRLRLPRSKTVCPITGIGAQTTGYTRGIVDLEITPHFESAITIPLKAHILARLTSAVPSIASNSPQWAHLENLQLADPRFQQSGKIELLIGADVYGQLLEGSVRHGPPQTPTAQLTKLGWIVSGPSTATSAQAPNSVLHCNVDHELHDLLERFWHQEEVCASSTRTLPTADQECESHFASSHSRDSNGRYIVMLPFRRPVMELGDSKASAIRMMHHLQRKFTTSPEFFAAYSAFLNEYAQLKHMIHVPDNDPEPEHVFYLPHHGVIKETSVTTKLRVVFNGSCQVTTGKNINELLHTGPKLQRDIFDVLLWIRQFKYIFSSDVEKMYRQIKVHENDWKFQRILWNNHGHIDKYELTTVTYGLSCAPYLALKCMMQLITDEGHKFPLAVDSLTNGRYVDDIFGGADSIPEAQSRAKQVLDICKAGGFPLRKWHSNQPTILQEIPSEYHASTPSVCIEDATIHALGLLWKPQADTFQFKLLSSQLDSNTKRAVLSRIAQIFDPLGLLSPVIIRLKIFLQELWAVKIGWDDSLPPSQLHTWNHLMGSLKGLDAIVIPRWINTSQAATIEFHGFCDASQLAMAAAIFVRVSNPDGSIAISLMCAKTKVAPLKRLTIPRLELSAAVMMTKLMAHCYKIGQYQTAQCYLWTDSSIVNTWLNNHPSRWKEFVHNRVCFIQETLPNAQWRHVPGICNPADCATRGLSATELLTHGLWWNGPPWLSQQSTEWPSSSALLPSTSPVLETRVPTSSKVCYSVKQQQPWDLLTKYSSLNKLLRITALCQHVFRANRSNPPVTNQPIVTPGAIDDAKLFWVRSIQSLHFQADLREIKAHQPLSKANPLIRLTPFIDHNEVLRVGGRLQHSALQEAAKHPVILPKDSYLSYLIIKNAHEQTLHGSTQQTLAYIRNEYWILGGRTPVQSVIRKCVTCTRYRQQRAQQLMGQLPPSRVNPARAFLHSGVDYAGPFTVKSWKGRTAKSYKSWVALFVCLATSAIHLELVSDYSAEAFIAAYRRFTGRRGICATLTSDCGTNFKGADRELQRLFSAESKELKEAASLIASDGTAWKFNPPAAPHFGGKWEAGVKSMKYHLNRIVGTTLLTYEELSTLLIQIESILNSRPLWPLTNDSDELSVLTPAHFLIGQPLTLIPEPNLEHLRQSRLSRWQHLSQMTQSFWTKWSREYLQRHQSMYKWNKISPPLQEGSIVFVIDERYPPAKWPLGKVIRLHPGRDNLVRVATIQTHSTTLIRPIVKLCPVDLTPFVPTSSSPESTKAGGNV